MVTHPGADGVRPFLKLLEVQALRGATDPELVRRFAATADEAAFRVIAERHGPMVFGVCARLLGNAHDAEDALQATFLVLARRAAAVRSSESLASWLHGVARRVSARLRRADRRRLAREQAAASPDVTGPADALAWAEVRAGLDEELARLPAAYREVLVLCYLEGLTRDEAGQRLGIEPGAVKGRLERGRRLLGERLLKRGIGLSAALAGVTVTPPVLAARVGRLAADPAAASPRAAALSHEFIKGVAMAKLKLVTAGLASVLVLAAGVGMGTAQTPDGAKAPPGAAPKSAAVPPPPEKDTDEAFIRRLSRDLRGTDPSPAEVHFFLASKDANKRAVLADLFVKERKDRADAARADAERVQADAAQVARAAETRAQAEAARAARARAEAEALALDAARLAEKGFRVPGAPPVPVDPRATPPVKVAPPTPPAPPVAPLPTFSPDGKRYPAPSAAPAPAANVELLRVRVQLAEVTVREKTLHLRNTEKLFQNKVVSAQEVELAKLEVERAQLQLREAQLTLDAARPPAAPQPGVPPARP